MARKHTFILAACLAIVLAGCATVSPTSAPVATQMPQATAVIAAATKAPAATAVAPAAAPASSAGGSTTKWTLDPAASQALFKAREQLAGKDLPNDAIGKTNAVQGAIVVDKQGAIVADQSKFQVDLNSLTSDQGRRDGFIKQSTLNTAQYPTAVFVPNAVQGLPSPIPDNGEGKFQLTGDLTLHGVTKSWTWDIAVQKAGNKLTGTATTIIKLTDFGMTPPKVPVVLSIEDNITLEIDFTFNQG